MPDLPHTASPIDSILLKQQFEEIEQLQLLIIKQQSSIQEAFDLVQATGVILFDRIKDLEALSSNKVIPKLEAAIKRVAAGVSIVDNKVPDSIPTH